MTEGYRRAMRKRWEKLRQANGPVWGLLWPFEAWLLEADHEQWKRQQKDSETGAMRDNWGTTAKRMVEAAAALQSDADEMGLGGPLEKDNADLRRQLAEKEAEIERLRGENEKLELQLDGAWEAAMGEDI